MAAWLLVLVGGALYLTYQRVSLRAATLAAGIFASAAYARIRKQFNQPVGRFEGVEAALTRMAGAAYIVDAARSFVMAATFARFSHAPDIASTRRYYQHVNKFSA
ncbi:MAG: hypothetical protein KA506_12050 [Steroidobacteraceae bacterium]|nr:hypothetical protein [Steroidobacteraceae bacterium]